jgi:D-glycero-D-manno-heptose 1,7-bisphosphate phosphatase
LNSNIEVFIEKKLDGTLGAIFKVKNKIKNDFFIFNGDTFFNFNYLDLIKLKKRNKNKNIFISLKSLKCKDVNRFNAYKFKDTTLVKKKKILNKKILISGGVILCRKNILNKLYKHGDLEDFFFSNKYLNKKIGGKEYKKPFIDIGVPNDFLKAENFIKKNFFKPAIYFDRDGVLNKIKKKQYIKKPSEFKWTYGAKKIIKYFNDNNYYIFIVTNQAGIAKGYIKLKNYFKIEKKICLDLALIGAHIDKIYFSPFHKDSKIKKFKRDSFLRKPNPGMLLKSFNEFSVVKNKSVVIGDQISDQIAAKRAGLKFLMFNNKNLFTHFFNNLNAF